MKEVTMYSTPTCHFCHMAEDYFKEKEIAYTKHDVSVDAEKRTEMMELTGQMGVPVIKIGDEFVIGFNQAKIEELLA
ncbi:MAG: glutaredoxin family protein [Candidatus Pacebacteria bacterium]|nr:glutaredoxin family protein [Candidatus Paceibacterota bacterium]